MQNIYQAKGKTLEAQYFDLGQLFASQIQKSTLLLAKKRARLSQVRREVAKRSWENLEKNENSKEFCLCLSAWARGANITPIQAMWLLADNLSGCQTFIGRYGDGVALLHTEEEFRDSAHIELHMSDPIVVGIRESHGCSRTLVYNNLMPGCGLYAWKKNMIVAVDSLFLKETQLLEVERPLLANVISWMLWRMKPTDATPEKVLAILESLGELVDGYAINVIRKVRSKVCGYKMTLARSETIVELLGAKVGSTLSQNNLINPDYPTMKWATAPRNIWRGGYRYYLNRYKTMDKHIKQYDGIAKMSTGNSELGSIHQIIQKTILSDLKDAYVNPDLGAVCVGLIDPHGTSVSVKKNDQNYDSLEVMDILN